MDAASAVQEGVVQCVDLAGNLVSVEGPEQINIEGLSTYLGQTTGVLVNDRCVVDDRRVPTFWGTWTLAGVQGGGLQGTYRVRFTPSPGFIIEMVISGGEGAFEEAAGWIRGSAELLPEGFTIPLDGLIFLPR